MNNGNTQPITPQRTALSKKYHHAYITATGRGLPISVDCLFWNHNSTGQSRVKAYKIKDPI
ncbi:hypothetical protein E2C01_052391 [Portunus trituberculatus]|uniref:Uncharacterized protein n=1 Tax=Portunus trituberculatus TaxID=210409 RepID=A0A5B7GMC4_PORTR|nr:hypothetical protein [Portunus trituberculatus]